MSSLQDVKRFGQSIRLDNLTRALLQNDGLRAIIACDGISGVTSNPSIVYKAVSGSSAYAADLASLRASGHDVSPISQTPNRGESRNRRPPAQK